MDFPHNLLRIAFYKLPGIARAFYAYRCRRLLSARSFNSSVMLLSFDCDNVQDIKDLDRISDFMDQQGIKATFAVPGEVLITGEKRFQGLKKRGHEFIGHGFKKHSDIVDGRYVSTFYYHHLSNDEIKEDIYRGNETIENVLGDYPSGFRIPHFGRSNSKKEMLRTCQFIKESGVVYSSSTLPVFGIMKGPLYRNYSGLYEMPVSGSYDNPVALLDTYSYGFSNRNTTFADYLRNVTSLVECFREKKICLNLYCDPSQAVKMEEWFRAMTLFAKSGYKFMTHYEFYKNFKG